MLVQGANGITIKADVMIDTLNIDLFDMMVLPGGWGGTDQLVENVTVQKFLKIMNNHNKLVGSICAAAFALDTAGVLSEHYTCYPSVEERISQPNYDATQQVIKEGNVMTSRGPGTAICFGLQIVKELVGQEQYHALKSGLLADFCD